MTSHIQSSLFVLIVALLIYNTHSYTIPFNIVEIDDNSNCNVPSSSFISFLQNEYPVTCTNYVYTISIELGTPPQKMILKLASRSSRIHIQDSEYYNNGFNPTKSLTYTMIITPKEPPTPFSDSVFSYDTLVIPGSDITINEAPFFLAKDPDSFGDALSSFAGELNIGLEDNKIPKQFSFNLLTYLYEKRLIEKRLLVFSINDIKSGSITIGKYPKEVKKLKRLRLCNPRMHQTNSNSNWSCMLNAVYMSNNRLFPINASVDFTIGGNAILPSEEFFKEIMEYFKEDIDNRKCKDSKFGVFYGVCCNNDYDESKLGFIGLVFGKWTLRLEMKDLFRLEPSGSKCLRIIGLKNNKSWYMSPSVLMRYYTLYDMDTEIVGFYPKDNDL